MGPADTEEGLPVPGVASGGIPESDGRPQAARQYFMAPLEWGALRSLTAGRGGMKSCPICCGLAEWLLTTSFNPSSW